MAGGHVPNKYVSSTEGLRAEAEDQRANKQQDYERGDRFSTASLTEILREGL